MTIREKTLAALKAPIAPTSFDLDPKDDRPGLDRIIEGLIQKAARGDVPAARELREYLELEAEM